MDTVQNEAPRRMTALDGGIEDGITWAVCRAPLYGAANGYVKIPEGHPWHELDYDEVHEAAPDLEVNGGLTFSVDGWIGFDTLHAGDYWPGGSHYCSTLPPTCGCTAWTDALVVEETKRLARQAGEAAR